MTPIPVDMIIELIEMWMQDCESILTVRIGIAVEQGGLLWYLFEADAPMHERVFSLPRA
jgi:hypothetical protein